MELLNSQNTAGIHVLSIWHTGTRSTLEYFGLPQDHNHYTHLNQEYDGMQAWRSASMYPHIIIPMRDPVNVWDSWQKRSHVRYGRPNGGANNPRTFNYVFKLAHQIWQRHNVMLLPVDLPERSEALDCIMQRTGRRPAVPSFPHVTDRIPSKPHTDEGIDWDSIYIVLNAMGLRYSRQAQDVQAVNP